MARQQIDDLLDAIGSIYQAVLDPSLRATTLNLIGRCVDANAVHMISWDTQTGSVVDSAVNSAEFQSASDAYSAYYGTIDPRRAEVLRRPAGELFRCHEAFDQRYVDRSEFFQDFLLKTGERWLGATHFDLGDGTSSILGVLRESDKKPFERETGATMSRLIPHLQRASLLQSKLAEHNGVALDAQGLLKALPLGCVLINGHGRVQAHNERFTNTFNDLKLRFAGSFLQFPQAGAQVRWINAVERVLVNRIPNSLDFASPGANTWRVHLMPIADLAKAASAEERSLMFAMFEMKTRSADQAIASLANHEMLTASECAVLRHLYEGESVKTIAHLRGVSVTTVRAQVAKVFSKTGYRSQRELIFAMRAF